MRLAAIAWQLTVGVLVTLVMLVIAIPAAALDIAYQGITGREGFRPTGMVFSWVGRLYKWNYNQISYGLTGSGSFMLLP
jgi:hypothetical protein